SGADGRFAFLNVPPGPVNVTVRYPGAPTSQVGPVVVCAGETSKIDVTVEGAEAAQQEPFLLYVIAPAERSETSAEVVHVLGKVAPECKVRVGDEDVEVYSTGGFARDDIPLEMGTNGVEVVATAPDGKTVTRALTVIRKKRPPPSPPSELKVVEPAQDLAVLPGEVLSIRATGPPGLSGYATGLGQPAKWPLAEVVIDDGQPTGRYTAAVRVGTQAFGLALPVRVCLQEEGAEPLWAESEGKVEVWDPAAVRVGETKGERAGITFGTHRVRLGGPYLAEVPAGTRFEIVGARGPDFRIRLSEALSGWVAKRDVVQLPAGTPPPHNFFTSCHIGGDEEYDKLSIRLKEKVVFAVTSETEPANQLYVDLFNTHHATTWLTHKSGAKVIGPVHCEQMADDWVRLTVPLRCKWIWGYWTETEGNVLSLYVRRPPAIAAAGDSPLKGRLFALEAGHGGRSSGAVGLMGTKEKTVNVHAVNELKKALEERGAKVVLVRPGDSAPSLWERARRANEAQADLYVSVHANATGRANGYLRVSGTSTYYRDEHCRRPAELVYNKLLELGWNEFGVVGNFSYAPLRNTYTPAILIEQAFMSHLADEARLLDPEYQRAQAEAVASALAEFFDSVRE
ncbi:MAG: N-acetylmuramoyl-L-alanine amidase, partial [Phycisphaerales bacterium]